MLAAATISRWTTAGNELGRKEGRTGAFLLFCAAIGRTKNQRNGNNLGIRMKLLSLIRDIWFLNKSSMSYILNCL